MLFIFIILVIKKAFINYKILKELFNFILLNKEIYYF
jgi:hypothetical protein